MMVTRSLAMLSFALMTQLGAGAPKAPPPPREAPSPVAGSAVAPTSPSQASPPLADMSVEIWPEYDDPRVLVIYSGSVDASVKLPADFSLAIPPGPQINMAGGIEPGGGHVHAEYRMQPRGDSLVDLSYTLQTRKFYMEFYYDPLNGSDDRRFTYRVVAPATVAKLVVKVQHPRRADNFAVSPGAQQVVQGGDGFPYSVIERDNVSAGASLPVSVSYHKSGREPSVQPQAAQMQTGPSSSTGQPMGGWRMFLVGLLAGVAACAVYHILRPAVGGGRDEDRPTDEKRDRPQLVVSSGDSRFCTQCGQALGPTNRYCGMCGTGRE